jgi:hypothetical protein
MRSAVVVALIIVNVSFWGVLAWLLMYASKKAVSS